MRVQTYSSQAAVTRTGDAFLLISPFLRRQVETAFFSIEGRRLLDRTQSAAGVHVMKLYWEDDYAIALALRRAHPTADPLDVDWALLHQWVVDLPGFADDQSITAQYLLENIQREWYEEVVSHESN